MTSAERYERLLAAIGRRARAQERVRRIPPPKVTRSRRRGYSREELGAAVAMADAYLLQHGRLSPTARGQLQAAQQRRAMRQPAGDFSTPAPYQPSPDQLATLDQLYQGQRMSYLAEHPIRGPQASWEPRSTQSKLAQALALLLPVDQGYLTLPLAKGLTKRDVRAQLLELSYVPSPPDRSRYPWSLLSEAEVQDVKRRLYAVGGPVTQRMATTGY
jgi:hypothetical protein